MPCSRQIQPQKRSDSGQKANHGIGKTLQDQVAGGGTGIEHAAGTLAEAAGAADPGHQVAGRFLARFS